MKTYPQPEDVTSPRQHWSLIKVLFKGDPYDYSIALGRWDDKPTLGIRWNANEDRPVGTPSSRGLPVWFIVPERLVDGIIDSLEDPEMRQFARHLIPKS